MTVDVFRKKKKKAVEEIIIEGGYEPIVRNGKLKKVKTHQQLPNGNADNDN